MCAPLALLGAGLSLAGGIMNGMQQQAYADEVNAQNRKAYEISKAARLAEQDRQAKHEQAATAAWQGNMDALTKQSANKNLDDTSQGFMAKFDQTAAQQAQEGTYLSGQRFANGEITKAIADTSATTAAEARKRAQALAQLSAYGTLGTTEAIGSSNTNNELSTITGLRRGSLTVSQQEQNIQPAKVTPGFGIGDILGGLGGMMLK